MRTLRIRGVRLPSVVLIFLGLAWRLGLGLGSTHILFYVVAFPLAVAFSIEAVKRLAHLPMGSYLTG